MKALRKAGAAMVAALTLTVAGVVGCGGGDDPPPTTSLPTQPPAADPLKDAPANVRMTWFGITNWHYQIGEKGVLLDGEVVNSGSTPKAGSVTTALTALKRTGSIDMILVGHVHPDHSVQIPEWAKQTGKTVYGPPALCTTLTNTATYALPSAQCVGLKGGEVIKVNEFATIRVVRWVHSVDCGEFSNGTGTPETFGFLFTVKTKDGKTLSWFVSDSGAGGPDLTTPRIVTSVSNGVTSTVTYGSPLANLGAAVKDAGLTGFEMWQGGPESRMVYQARTVVPAFNVKTFMPHHLDSRAAGGQSFSLRYGMHYAYSEDDQPKLKQFLSILGVPQIYPRNYFDAWVYDKDGIRTVDNAAMKADYGLPATGPGPGTQFANPRAGALECDGD
jgi:hypothetical protein